MAYEYMSQQEEPGSSAGGPLPPLPPRSLVCYGPHGFPKLQPAAINTWLLTALAMLPRNADPPSPLQTWPPLSFL